MGHSSKRAKSPTMLCSGNSGELQIRVINGSYCMHSHSSAFTCNMHSLGTKQEICLEFLKKHVVAHNLSKGTYTQLSI